MGKYIKTDSNGEFIGDTFQTKIGMLHMDGATSIPPPTIWKEGLVCVVNNIVFAAAGYAYDEREMQLFLNETSRETQWLKYKHAKDVAQ